MLCDWGNWLGKVAAGYLDLIGGQAFSFIVSKYLDLYVRLSWLDTGAASTAYAVEGFIIIVW